MATPIRDAIATFMSITGASEPLARRKLEEYGGNLNEAVNSHFRGIDSQITSPSSVHSSDHNSFDSSNRSQSGQHGLLPILSAARSFKPSLLFDPNYRRDLFNRIRASGFTSRASLGSHTRVERRDEQIHSHPGHIEDRRGIDTSLSHGWGPPSNRVVDGEVYAPLNTSNMYDHDVEEEMIQAAINASKEDYEIQSGNGNLEGQFNQEDDLARVVSISLKVYCSWSFFSCNLSFSHHLVLILERLIQTAEQEQALREQQMKVNDHELGIVNRGMLKSGSSSRQGRTQNVGETSNHSGGSNDSSGCEEWGVISTKEFDEALMLENALFGDVHEGASTCSSSDTNHHSGLGGSRDLNMLPVNHSSFSNSKEQQDEEYRLSLLLNKQKLMDTLKEAETHHLKKEESESKLLNKMEIERSRDTKKASLPCEPALDDKNAVTILIRMPNGCCLSHRFLRSDKLQLLFDFIDSSGAVEFGTYKVVRSYPRSPFGVNDSLLSLGDLGLTNKQEALFLEFI